MNNDDKGREMMNEIHARRRRLERARVVRELVFSHEMAGRSRETTGKDGGEFFEERRW